MSRFPRVKRIVPIVQSPILTLPFFILIIGYGILGSILELRLGRRRNGLVGLLLLLALIVFYVYNLLYGL